jgi:MOSC domain-containing protein YiiM
LDVERWTLDVFFVAMHIDQIFTSPGHNYFGHHGRAPGDFSLIPAERIECVAGQGIRGDRFFAYRENYKGQITFFSREVFELMTEAFGLTNKSPGILRRNLIVSGIDLNELIGVDFTLQGVHFRGTNDCKPCYWMDTAFAPGAEKFLAGRGGLRARILSTGWVSVGDAQLEIVSRANGKEA